MIDPKTKRKIRGRLKGLELVELSLVDVPANPGATISIFKRGDPTAPSHRGIATMQRTTMQRTTMKAVAIRKATEAEQTCKNLEDDYMIMRDVDRPTAVAALASDPVYKRAYADHVFNKMAADIKPCAGESVTKRLVETVTKAGAEGELERLAAEHAKQHNVSKAAGYDAVLSTPEGKKLYRETLEVA